MKKKKQASRHRPMSLYEIESREADEKLAERRKKHKPRSKRHPG